MTQPTTPKWMEEFEEKFPRLMISINESPWDRAERVEGDGAIMKEFISKVEKETIERCVGELTEWKEELEEIMRQTAIERDEKLIAIYLSQINALDTAITKLREMK